MPEAVYIFNVLNPMIMRKISPQKTPVRSQLKMLFTAVKGFFTSNTNREFRRLKDFISS
jgi:hypothetical protein